LSRFVGKTDRTAFVDRVTALPNWSLDSSTKPTRSRRFLDWSAPLSDIGRWYIAPPVMPRITPRCRGPATAVPGSFGSYACDGRSSRIRIGLKSPFLELQRTQMRVAGRTPSQSRRRRLEPPSVPADRQSPPRPGTGYFRAWSCFGSFSPPPGSGVRSRPTVGTADSDQPWGLPAPRLATRGPSVAGAWLGSSQSGGRRFTPDGRSIDPVASFPSRGRRAPRRGLQDRRIGSVAGEGGGISLTNVAKSMMNRERVVLQLSGDVAIAPVLDVGPLKPGSNPTRVASLPAS